MNDDKVSVREALDKLYDLSWMVGSTAMEYLTDKDGEKIRDYIEVKKRRSNATYFSYRQRCARCI